MANGQWLMVNGVRRSWALCALMLTLVAAAAPRASGPLGIYGIVEKVVFEPNEAAPERIQLWGAFAYVDGGPGQSTISTVRKGYLYFRMGPVSPDFPQSYVTLIKNEWADLKSVAGTGQAVGFGQWGYIAGFATLDPEVMRPAPNIIYEGGQRHPTTDLRVRPAEESPKNPALYETNAGVVKITAATHDAVVKALQAALK